MSGVHLTAILLSTLCLATPAMAKIDPSNCEVPELITIVARGADGVSDPLGIFTVVVRDFNNVPEWGATVTLDFSNCPDIRVCADQGDPNVVVDCTGRTVRAVTGESGRATFRVIGGAVNLGASPGSSGPSLKVYASVFHLKTVRVAALDQNGCDGVDANDLSMWLADSFSGQTYARSDYNGDGTLDPNDLSLWLAASLGGASALGCEGTTCP